MRCWVIIPIVSLLVPALSVAQSKNILVEETLQCAGLTLFVGGYIQAAAERKMPGFSSDQVSHFSNAGIALVTKAALLTSNEYALGQAKKHTDPYIQQVNALGKDSATKLIPELMIKQSTCEKKFLQAK